MTQSMADLVLLSNGPGELSTWVRPVLQALMRQPRFDRASILLSPCPHAGGNEEMIAKTFPGVDRVLGPQHFFTFLLQGKTPDVWSWHRQGVVVFLGGDQFYAVAIGKRLGYPIVTYAEWAPRWLPWITYCGIAQPQMLHHIPHRYRSKIRVVGNLITDLQPAGDSTAYWDHLDWPSMTEIVGLLPGSKPAKLRVGVPFCLRVADQLQDQRPQTRCVIPMAPGLSLATLFHYADSSCNPLAAKYLEGAPTLVQPDSELPHMITSRGTKVWLWSHSPAYELLTHCQICLTTVGANTAELAALSVPMMVILPTQHLDGAPIWEGVLGLMGRWAGMRKVIRHVRPQRLTYRAWPNIWADREIVPEWVRPILPDEVAQYLLTVLASPRRLSEMRASLDALRGQGGSVSHFAQLISATLEDQVPPEYFNHAP